MAVLHNLITAINDAGLLPSGLLCAAAFLLATIGLLRRWWTRPRNLPPGPSLFTSVALLVRAVVARRNAPHLIFTDLAAKYGPVFSVWIGPHFITVVTDFELAKQALIKNPESFAVRKNMPILDRIFRKGGGVISENGHPWKERRRFGMSSMRIFGVGKRSLESKINEEATYLAESFAEHGGQPFNPGRLVINAVSNIIAYVSFGQRFEYGDAEFQEMVQLVQEVGEVAVLDLGNIFPALADSFIYKEKKTKFRRFKEFIEDRVRRHKETFDADNPRDLIDVYLHEISREAKELSDHGKEPIFTESNMWRFIQDLFLGGTETTSNSILWLLILVTLHPDVQRKVQDEIDDIIGRSRQPCSADMSSMPYTQAVIHEGIRRRPVIPVYSRETPADRSGMFAHYTVLPESYLLVNVYGIHHDPKLFPDPEAFRPERFLTINEHGERTFSGKGQPLVNFGLGRRACVGEAMARTELFLYFVNLLQRFNFSFPAEDGTVDLEGIPGRMWSPSPFRVCAVPR